MTQGLEERTSWGWDWGLRASVEAAELPVRIPPFGDRLQLPPPRLPLFCCSGNTFKAGPPSKFLGQL